MAAEDVCAEFGGEVYYDFETCEPNPCPRPGACCLVDPPIHPCVDGVFEDDGYESGGVAWYENQMCDDVDCQQYTPANEHR